MTFQRADFITREMQSSSTAVECMGADGYIRSARAESECDIETMMTMGQLNISPSPGGACAHGAAPRQGVAREI